MSVAGPYISFLTDFGGDTAPAVCRGVMLSIVPDARINDLTHASRQFAVRDAAFLLWSAVPYLPVAALAAALPDRWLTGLLHRSVDARWITWRRPPNVVEKGVVSDGAGW
jgi:hypothetical protein